MEGSRQWEATKAGQAGYPSDHIGGNYVQM